MWCVYGLCPQGSWRSVCAMLTWRGSWTGSGPACRRRLSTCWWRHINVRCTCVWVLIGPVELPLYCSVPAPFLTFSWAFSWLNFISFLLLDIIFWSTVQAVVVFQANTFPLLTFWDDQCCWCGAICRLQAVIVSPSFSLLSDNELTVGKVYAAHMIFDYYKQNRAKRLQQQNYSGGPQVQCYTKSTKHYVKLVICF